MFARLLCVLVTTSSVIAAGIHRRHYAEADSSPGACSTGSMQCCESTAAADSPSGSGILALIGMPFEQTTGLIGFNCNPINFNGGVSDPACQQSPVCCANNNVGGFFSMGCVPFVL